MKAPKKLGAFIYGNDDYFDDVEYAENNNINNFYCEYEDPSNQDE